MNQPAIKRKDIVYQQWLAKEAKATLIIAHGMAEHALRYHYVAQKMNEAGISVYAIHHIGHGANIQDIKGHWEHGDYQKCVRHMDELIAIAKEENPDSKIFLLGHSMGSFMAQSYLKLYSKNIDGVLLSGSNAANSLFRFGKLAALVVGFFSKEKKPNKMLDALSFGSFNRKFKPNRTKFDWLTRDTAIVDAYVADPLCGFVCTTSFFREFTAHLAKLDKNLYTIRYDLPIYIFSGEDDPVGNFGKGPQKLYEQYKNKCNVEDVSLKLYPEARHETLNETNKDEVIQDCIDWMITHA